MDGLSLSASAAGLVSLGLTAAGGLLQYCRDCQSRDADLAHLSNRAQQLESFLAVAKDRTLGVHRNVNTALQDCLNICDACLQDFKRLNNRYTNPEIKRHKKLARKLKYPFDKGKFEDVRAKFREFHTELHGYLQLVSLDVTRDIRIQMVSESVRVSTAVETVGRQIQSSVLSAERAIGDTIRDRTDRLDMSIRQDLQRAEDNISTSLTAGMHLLSENVEKGQEQQTMAIMPFRRKIIASGILEYSSLAWARDWRIYPNLTFRATVPRDSPAFECVRDVKFIMMDSGTVQEIKTGIENCLVELQQIFTSGNGWPTDTLVFGDNLLHLSYLCASMVYMNVSHIASTEFLYQILLRSKSQIVRLLKNDPSLLYDPSDWPEGLSILVKFSGRATASIINITDESGATALKYAIYMRRPSSVRLLTDAGANAEMSTFLSVGKEKNGYTVESKAIIRIIAESIARRRRELSSLAFRYLDFATVEELGLGENLLDCRAFDVAKALEQRQIPTSLIYNPVGPGSVYHYPEINHLIAQSLFDAGFQQTNTELYGYTPLMTHRYCYSEGLEVDLKLISWFEDRGADIHAPIPEPRHQGRAMPDYQVIHMISYWLGHSAGTRRPINLSVHSHSLFSRLLRDQVRDPCLCYCTEDGCVAASAYARGVGSSGVYVPFCERAPLLGRVVYDGDRHTVALNLIRVITFERLGMRHTCCQYKLPFDLNFLLKDRLLSVMDPSDVDEIREEDRYLAISLEFLMGEFEANLLEADVPLSRFMNEFWEPRMLRWEEERDELSVEDSHAIREIGVVLEETGVDG
ncbi:hypothetical protein GGR52DRAFT_581598 [Hypoxylon sp. FL1284]|nr:hypothetical protein GGR52DRAFT_581598 [Hypoxylon sp. FL1284]